MPLLPQHLADLRSSGLNDATIRRCAFSSSSDPAEVGSLLRWTGPAYGLGPCLLIPYFDKYGKPTDYVKVKPDRRLGWMGDGCKYLAPKGAANRAYFPPDTIPGLADSSIPLVFAIVEGEKKSAKMDQDGFKNIGINGVHGWNVPRTLDLIPDIASLPLRWRRVTICFDSDVAYKPAVQLAEHRLADALYRHGAIVRTIRLPPGPPEPEGKPGKLAADDLLVQPNGLYRFQELLETAPHYFPKYYQPSLFDFFDRPPPPISRSHGTKDREDGREEQVEAFWRLIENTACDMPGGRTLLNLCTALSNFDGPTLSGYHRPGGPFILSIADAASFLACHKDTANEHIKAAIAQRALILVREHGPLGSRRARVMRLPAPPPSATSSTAHENRRADRLCNKALDQAR